MSTFQYWRSGSELESAAPQKPLIRYDLISFLGAAQTLKIAFLPILWQPALDHIGQGATAEIREASMNKQTSFAFKRPRFKGPFEIEFENRLLPSLIAEMSILSHPSVREFPNIVKLEGICFEIISEGHVFSREEPVDHTRGGVVPVLVFEKAKYGDLRIFMACNVGKSLSLKDRLQLCIDIVRAVEEMHSNDIIRGDIKPENVLVFDKSSDGYMAKVSDFGYSTQYATLNDLISLPKSELWHAPEWHHRGFTPLAAKKTDAYSFGMLVLWLLCYSGREDSDRKFKGDMATKSNDSLALAQETLPAESLCQSNGLVQFFNKTLTSNTAQRCSDFCYSRELLGSERNQHGNSKQQIYVSHHSQFESFQILRSIDQFYQADYRVRLCIIGCLFGKLSTTKGSKNDTHAWQDLLRQSAVCYELGFGIKRDRSRSRLLLEKHEICQEHFYRELNLFRNYAGDYDFYTGSYLSLREKGQLGLIDLAEGYRGQVGIDSVRREYQGEITDTGEALGFDHYVVLVLKQQLESALSRHGQWAEAAELQVQVMEWSQKALGQEHADTLSSMGNLAVNYWKQDRFVEAEKLQVQVTEVAKRILGEEHSYTLASVANLASTYRSQSRWNEAEGLELQLVEISRRVLGEEHSHTVLAMGNLANTYMIQERWDEAEELQTQVIEKLTTLLGGEHPDTLTNRANLAATYRNRNREEDAERLEFNAPDSPDRPSK